MTSETTPDRDENKIAALLRTLNSDANDAPVPDAAFLEQLRLKAAAMFDEAGSPNVMFPAQDEAQTTDQAYDHAEDQADHQSLQALSARSTRPARRESETGTTKPDTKNQKRRNPMMILLASRGFAGLIATASAVLLWLSLAPSTSALSTTPFSSVLAELQRSSSMQLKLNKNGRSADVWIKTPGLLRLEESPQKYQIASGSRLWSIDESAQTSTESDSPWYVGPQNQIDLFGLLDVGLTDASSLLKAKPVDRTSRQGRDCLVYRIALPTKVGMVDVEATADAKSLQLVEILAWQSGRKRQGPPLAEMQFVAMNAPIADETFAVTKSLSEDGRIGKITDAQGIVVLRPALAKRWTPVCRDTLLQPGDWLRTELRGANAVKVTLTNGLEMTLGPATLVEFISETQARVHSGMLQTMSPKQDAVKMPDAVNTTKAANVFVLMAPREGRREIKPGDKLIVRVDRNDTLVDVATTPAWLAGFEGTSDNESLGSLIVTMPDGRNEPLTVGYHKVTVEIRDQIARTTIEESFVNHTLSRLEGVFHFPLPQDASISGFGMWIGNDLIEADVVERQRAREIYETILREKRDPGLLEWNGGNIFKARVFPIEAQSEKRIRIVYTEVLPLRSGRYRYTYGLRSELLRTKPLRELSLNVTVSSELPLKGVTCSTHAARIQQAAHSGSVEFAAQEYSPTRDFEVVCEVDGKQSDVVVIPHQRGNDGYFLIQLSPPGPDGNWQRELLADGDPLTLILLCDTSMSMDEEKRRQQTEFVSAVLATLSPADRFQLVASDVTTAWASDAPMSATPGNIATATKFLSERISLGWSDLDRAFSDVTRRAPEKSHVVYVGDGILSAGDTDPAAFVKRLQQLASGQRQPSEDTQKARLSLHSVTVGNTSDSVVMKGIATAGGGSARAVGGEQTASVVALELLNEMARPGLRDLKVDFRGLKVAAVYPEHLPNIPAGTQQILVGRYLPEGDNQQGEIIVTGKRGTEDVRFAARLNLKNAEDGNSFIPRLWARAHLDQLLAQGSSPTVQEDIIRLSEEFHIITPYTSLLVLETDADRDRFGVKRRYEMRDGERFFTEGRTNASFELVQQQMQRAGNWRLGLRRRVLSRLASLGRDEASLRNQLMAVGQLLSYERAAGRNTRLLTSLSDSSSMTQPGRSWMSKEEEGVLMNEELAASWDVKFLGDSNSWRFKESKSEGFRLKQDAGFDGPTASDEIALQVFAKEGRGIDDNRNGPVDEMSDALHAIESEGDFGLFVTDKQKKTQTARGLGGGDGRGGRLVDRLSLFDDVGYFNHRGLGYQPSPDYTSWVNTLFPGLSPAPQDVMAKSIEATGWTAEAIALSKSLLRSESLQAMDGGINLLRDIESFDSRWERSTRRTIEQMLYSPTAWVTRGQNPDEQTLVNFCNATERGVYSLAFGLGRIRKSVATELKSPSAVLGLNDSSLSPIHEAYSAWTATVESAGENRARLVISLAGSTTVVHVTIDIARHVIIRSETFRDERSEGFLSFADFVEVAGSWWATRIESHDADGKLTSQTRLTLKALTKDKTAQRTNEMLAERAAVQFFHQPGVKLKVARQKVADGAAAFDDVLTMILHNVQLQQWDESLKLVDAMEKLAADKPGVRWIRTLLLATMRRNEDARQRLIAEAQRLLPMAQQDEIFLAEFILGQLNTIADINEFRDVHQQLKPVYSRPWSERVPAISGRRAEGDPLDARMLQQTAERILGNWTEREASCLERLGKFEEVLKARREIAVAQPWNLHAQQLCAQRLAASGQFDAAHAWIRQELARPQRSPQDDDTLRQEAMGFYRQTGRWADLLKWTTEWIARNPDTQTYYSAYANHLSAMICNDQLEAAYVLADQWLKEGRVAGRMTKVQQMRFDAALNFANGQVPNLNFQQIDERWFEPLAETARFFVKHPHQTEIAGRCASNQHFVQSETMDRLRGEWLMLLRAEVTTLTPTQIDLLLGYVMSGRTQFSEPIDGRTQLDASEVPDSIWEPIAATLKTRWAAIDQSTDAPIENKTHKHLLGAALQKIYAIRFSRTLLLPFLREQVTTAHTDDKTLYIQSLMTALKDAAWTAESEVEAFAVLRTLAQTDSPGQRLQVEAPELHQLVDAMLNSRITAGEKALGDQGELNKLTRKELAERNAALRKIAKIDLAARLAELARTDNGPLAPWFRMEQLWLDVQLNQNYAESEAVCWQILGDAPSKPQAEQADGENVAPLDPNDPPQQLDEKAVADRIDAERLEFLAEQLRRRAFTSAMHLAVRSSAPPESAVRLLKYIDAGIALGGDATTAWRETKFQLLIALDRPDELEHELTDWIQSDVSTGPWRQMLAQLLAERGKINEAIALFEACEKDKLLTASDYQMLSDWYLATDNRPAYERARVESFKLRSENELAQLLYAANNRWSQPAGQLPSEFDENTLFVLRALYEKSANPENYLYYVRSLYGACRDFRLLQMIPDAVLGRTPQQVYAFLQNLNGGLLVELRNEATADEILARISKLRIKGTPTAIDLRALDLLEAMIERRSAEVVNQPGPHVEASLAAMQRAFKREWAEGEPRMMATFLAQLGAITNEQLKAEQIRELRELVKAAAPAGRDHLAMTSDLCQLLFLHYGERDEALRLMESEVRDYTQASKGIWPHTDNELLSRYVSLMESASRHVAGEQLLKKYEAASDNDEQKLWIQARLVTLYRNAFDSDGIVSIGKGRAELFAPLVAMMLNDLEAAPSESVRYQLLNELFGFFRTAHQHKLSGVVAAVESAVFKTIPKVLSQQESYYSNTVGLPVQVVRDVLGLTKTLQYIVERMENYPDRFEIQYNNSWNTLGNSLGELRSNAGASELDDRVLRLVLKKLKKELRAGYQSYSYIDRIHYGWFWLEKKADFAAAAEEVLHENRASGRRSVAVAEYLRNGLDLAPRAIEILEMALGNGLLDFPEQATLVVYLRDAKRYAEMIPILERLSKVQPGNLQYRTDLITAYFYAQRPEQMQTLLTATHDYFHQEGRWTEGSAVQLASTCVEIQQPEQARSYFTEAIVLHQRANPGSGLNDGILSSYYQQLAQVESTLHHTREAVEATISAIVCWDARSRERSATIQSLNGVLNAAQDLDAFVTAQNAAANESGQDNPILRKALGQTYQARGEHAKAIAQFLLTLDLQPNDRETRQALVTSFDASDNPAAATLQLRKLIDLQSHDLTLYKQLADRMKGDPVEAERAATSIIESSPNEAESHTAMAELRQTQNRWLEAIPHWQQVARYRKLEPTGLLKLAEAQIHEKQFVAARKTLATLKRNEWPSHFRDVDSQVRQLEGNLPVE